MNYFDKILDEIIAKIIKYATRNQNKTNITFLINHRFLNISKNIVLHIQLTRFSFPEIIARTQHIKNNGYNNLPTIKVCFFGQLDFKDLMLLKRLPLIILLI